MPAPPRLPRGPKPRALLIELIPVLAETGWVAPAQLPTVLINDSIHGLAFPSLQRCHALFLLVAKIGLEPTTSIL